MAKEKAVITQEQEEILKEYKPPYTSYYDGFEDLIYDLYEGRLDVIEYENSTEFTKQVYEIVKAYITGEYIVKQPSDYDEIISLLKEDKLEEAFEIIDCFRRIENDHMADRRWSSDFREVYKIEENEDEEAKFFEVIREIPATENQEVFDPIKSIKEVFPVEKTVIKYE